MTSRTTDAKPFTVECPTCKARVAWNKDNPWRPFCSERCRLIDLGDWLEERNRIPDQSVNINEEEPGGS